VYAAALLSCSLYRGVSECSGPDRPFGLTPSEKGQGETAALAPIPTPFPSPGAQASRPPFQRSGTTESTCPRTQPEGLKIPVSIRAFVGRAGGMVEPVEMRAESGFPTVPKEKPQGSPGVEMEARGIEFGSLGHPWAMRQPIPGHRGTSGCPMRAHPVTISPTGCGQSRVALPCRWRLRE
jgi:hypothetical protein